MLAFGQKIKTERKIQSIMHSGVAGQLKCGPIRGAGDGGGNELMPCILFSMMTSTHTNKKPTFKARTRMTHKAYKHDQYHEEKCYTVTL